MKEKKFAVCYNKNIENSNKAKDDLVHFLQKNSVYPEIFDIDNLKSGADFVFVIGGDGTILKTARFYSKFSTPVFGINLGRLGFLSQSSKENLEYAAGEILKGNYTLEDRIMLQSENFTALNDFVIKGGTRGRTSSFGLKINGKFVCNYLADGIIISTPTGSTAYGLSAGGPVLYPSLDAFVIVPICPHTLTARPIVIPDTETITICTPENSEKYVVSTDGQAFYEFENKIEIKKSNLCAKLALLNDCGFYSVLKDKLHWGISPLN